jgi:pimeloyl-ACP methyl ester carboxylesterase
VGRGIDPSAYSLAEAAADVEDLRVALGIERWNLGGYGSGARLAFEILRRDGEHVRSLYLDSPEAPQTDLLTTAILGTRAATGRLAAACRSQPACNRRFPGLARSLVGTLKRRERRPLRLRATRGGRTIPVTLDGGTTLRALRETLATDPRRAPLAFAAGDGALRSARQDWIAERPAFTLGYAVHQGDTFTFAHGAWFSTVCRDQLAFVSRAALRRLTVGAPAFREAFAESPLHAICRVWDVGRTLAAVRTPVASNVPSLVFVGRFDPYGPEAQARRAVSKLRRSWVVVDPSWAYNVMHEPCAHAVRNRWLDAPQSPPDKRCLARLRPLRFALR